MPVARSLNDYKPLRLIAEDGEDLKVISAYLQDAVAKVGDFAWLPAERRFAFVANRFVWECAGVRRNDVFARVRAGAHFGDVKAVRQVNIRADAKNAVLELLAIRHEPGEAGDVVTLDFAGGGAIQLDVEAVNAELRDISEPWPTRSRPGHDA